VLIAIPQNHLSGKEAEMVEDLKKVLTRQGLMSQLCSLGIPLGAGLPEDSIRPVYQQLGFVKFLRLLARRLPSFDVLHIVYLSGASFTRAVLPSILIARFLGKKVILDYRSPLLFNRLADRTWFFKRVWKLCDLVLVLSAYQRQFVNSLGGTAEFITARADTREIKPQVRSALQPRIVVATDLEKEFDVVCAIRAYQLVKQKYPRTEMTVIGSGREKSSLENLVGTARIPGITFAGGLTRRQRWDIFTDAELYVNCSTIDYLSTEMVEALAHGLPVLTTPVSGSGEPFRSGENIILLSYNDHAVLADRIIELIEDPQLTEKLSRNARLAAQRLDLAAAGEEWGRLFRRVAFRHE
jgi:glycosyltransferase involved in cell wall biosynthesis